MAQIEVCKAEEREIPQELDRLNNSILGIIDETNKLVQRLKPVLTADPVVPQEVRKKIDAKTDVGRTLVEFNSKIMDTFDTIHDISCRLEI